jgi:hypothetical protein
LSSFLWGQTGLISVITERKLDLFLVSASGLGIHSSATYHMPLAQRKEHIHVIWIISACLLKFSHGTYIAIKYSGHRHNLFAENIVLHPQIL